MSRLRVAASVNLVLLLAMPTAAMAAGFTERRIPKEEIRSVWASSTSDALIGGQAAYRTIYLIDGVLWSPWGEGALGNGVGERVRIELGGTRYVTRVGLVNGNGRNYGQWKGHGRAKAITLRFRHDSRDFPLADTLKMQYMELGSPVETDFVEIVAKEVYQDSGTGPLCFSEVELYEPENVLELRPGIKQDIETAVRKLRNVDPDTSDAGMKELKEIGAPAIPWLVGLKADPSAEVRRKVAVILGHTASPAAASVLQEIYEGSPERQVRGAALDSLKELHSAEAVPFLVKVAETEDTVFVRKALLAMEGLGDRRTLKVFLNNVLHGNDERAAIAIRHIEGFGDAAIRALRPHLRSKSDKVKARAVWAIGRASGEKALGTLMGFIRGGDPPIVIAALRGLGETRSPEAFDLLALNADHEDPAIRAAVAGAMGNFKNRSAAELLEQMIKKDQAVNVRQEAWRALSACGRPGVATLKRFVEQGTAEQHEEAFQRLVKTPGKAALAALIDLLGDRRRALRDKAVRALKQRPDGGERSIVQALGHEDSAVRFAVGRYLTSLGKRVVPALLPVAMASEDPSVRVAALRVLGDIGDKRAVTAVFRGMRAATPQVRCAAVMAASRLPSERYGNTLVALLDDPDDDVRLGAIEALGRGRHKAAVPTLVNRLKAGDRNSIRIIWALGEIGDERAVPALMTQYRSNEPFTRQKAVEALGKVGGSEAMLVLMEAMVDPDRSVRKKAEAALQR